MKLGSRGYDNINASSEMERRAGIFEVRSTFNCSRQHLQLIAAVKVVHSAQEGEADRINITTFTRTYTMRASLKEAVEYIQTRPLGTRLPALFIIELS